jgi:hypothetical protein
MPAYLIIFLNGGDVHLLTDPPSEEALNYDDVIYIRISNFDSKLTVTETYSKLTKGWVEVTV